MKKRELERRIRELEKRVNDLERQVGPQPDWMSIQRQPDPYIAFDGENWIWKRASELYEVGAD
jgi:hypothetical protein